MQGSDGAAHGNKGDVGDDDIFRAVEEDLESRLGMSSDSIALVERQQIRFSDTGTLAWVEATAQGSYGGALTWYEEYVVDAPAEDGTPLVQALLHQRPDPVRWEVAELWIDPDSANPWWRGMWFGYGVPCTFFAEVDGSDEHQGRCPAVHEPQPGGLRTSIMRAIHAQFLDAELCPEGPENCPNAGSQILADWIRVGNGYAFVRASVTEVDWSVTEYCDSSDPECSDPYDPGQFEVLLQQNDAGDWEVAEGRIAATGVWWEGIWLVYRGVPCALFGVDVCEGVAWGASF